MNYINLDGIGEKISKLRKEQGVTIRELSEYTGYSVGSLSKSKQSHGGKPSEGG